ncbi:hypothetical protein KBTX_03588 [wastewater metagenome]|uniref:Type IV pilus modification protein PilV n=2 Tax=unclassified sequences TaxID=12908 RepID=A0A5B8REE5_9ZZZZ|nr:MULTISPECIES: type IV pilus modification protein PilV [Arhodomonas]MCS4502830.1 type IV pilus modification protein PilV [Arhodomonas aquaeolei]QEA07240.1 hypothetical protein KBTEX_03588 [uncultured organism]
MASPLNLNGHSRGFTLIEVLVALLVLSVGLLGLASLQTSGLRLSDSSYLRSQAVLAGYDLIDRIRLDRQDAPDYDTSGNFVDESGDVSVQQFKDWVSTQLSRLPSGAASVDCDGTSAVCTVRIRWNDSRAGGEDEQTFTIETRV